MKGAHERSPAKDRGLQVVRLPSEREISPVDITAAEAIISAFPEQKNTPTHLDYCKEAEASFLEFLVVFNLSPERMLSSLREGDDNLFSFNSLSPTREDLVSPEYLLKNMRRMAALERTAPGSVRYLYNHHGIRNFARYSIAFWERQFRERTSQLPYMLVISAADLATDILASTTVYTQLQDDLKTLERPHLMRMIEISSVPEMLRLLGRLDHAHNEQGTNQIPLVVFDGHGNNERVILKANVQIATFGAADLKGPRFERSFQRWLTKAFTPNAQFLFGSCEAAYENIYGESSVAKHLKTALQNLLGRRVRVAGAQNYTTPFTKLAPSLRKDGALTLVIESHPFETIEGKVGKPRFRNL